MITPIGNCSPLVSWSFPRSDCAPQRIFVWYAFIRTLLGKHTDLALDQLHQAVSQKLQSPFLPTLGRLAVGQCFKNRFSALIQFLPCARAWVFVECSFQIALDKSPPSALHGWNAGVQSLGYFPIGLAFIGQEQNPSSVQLAR
jgi:hypothetical protein